MVLHPVFTNALLYLFFLKNYGSSSGFYLCIFIFVIVFEKLWFFIRFFDNALLCEVVCWREINTGPRVITVEVLKQKRGSYGV
jgi:hypothetical protein